MFFVNGSEVGGCSGTLGWTGEYGEDYGEIHTAADQMPGGYDAGDSEQWTNSFLFVNNVQQNYNGFGGDNNTSWCNLAIYSQTQADENDKSCPT